LTSNTSLILFNFLIAYCKSLIDTQWYHYDDSNCIPITDNSTNNNNPQNIYNDGSSGVCTENAYILFYKLRDCMRNEKWWKPYIDRVLYDYDEFHYFLANLDLIEKHQQRKINEQNKQFNQPQSQVQIISKENSGTHINGIKKISSGVKTLRKFLGNSNSSSRIEETLRFESSNESVPTHESLSRDSNYQRESNKKNDRLNYQEEMSNSNSEIVLLNYYDEIIKPKRLMKQNNPSSNSSNSLNAAGSTSSVSSSSPLSKQNASQVSGLNFDNLILTNDRQNSNLLNYPSDNDYTNFNEGAIYHSDYCYNDTSRYISEKRNTQITNPRINNFNSTVPNKSLQTLNGQVKTSNQNGEKAKNRYANSTSIETNI